MDDDIDRYYEKKREDSKREYAKLKEMIEGGESREKIIRQEEIALDAGYTGD